MGGKGASREPSRDPPPTPALLRWGRGRPWRLCRLLSAELKPNYPQLINLEPIRIFPTTCTCSQEPGRGRRDGAHSGHSGEGEGAAGWVRRTPRPAQRRDKGPQGRGAWQRCCYQEEDLLEAAVAVALGTGQLLPPALTSTLAAPPSGPPHPPPTRCTGHTTPRGGSFPSFCLAILSAWGARRSTRTSLALTSYSAAKPQHHGPLLQEASPEAGTSPGAAAEGGSTTPHLTEGVGWGGKGGQRGGALAWVRRWAW